MYDYQYYRSDSLRGPLRGPVLVWYMESYSNTNGKWNYYSHSKWERCSCIYMYHSTGKDYQYTGTKS